jgi:N-methylhydantoinase A
VSTFRIGIDVGGTFTDIVCVAANGMTTLAKASSIPLDQSEGVVNGLAVLAERLA